MLKVLVIDGSPEPSSPVLVAELAKDADFVIAVDRGAMLCRATGIAPDLFVGDEDSIDTFSRAWVHEQAGRLVKLEVEKDATDLAVALENAKDEAARRGEPYSLTVTCATGGRPDHALAVIGLLAQYRRAHPRLVEDGYELAILSPEGADSWAFSADEVGRTFSAIALKPGTEMRELGMRWEYSGEVPLLSDLGVSNVVVEPDAKVWCDAGCLAAFLIKG